MLLGKEFILLSATKVRVYADLPAPAQHQTLPVFTASWLLQGVVCPSGKPGPNT